jgi:hypothetical protein
VKREDRNGTARKSFESDKVVSKEKLKKPPAEEPSMSSHPWVPALQCHLG